MLLSGRTAAGKTTVAPLLAAALDASVLSVRQALVEMTDARLNRADLQRAGADLDRRTNGRWLVDYLAERTATESLVVDALRTRRQTEPVLRDVSGAYLVFLTAHDSTRRLRYKRAGLSDPVKRAATFDAAENHPTERNVVELEPLAHLVVATDELTPQQVVQECVQFVRSHS